LPDRDWKRIESELDAMRPPGIADTSGPAVADQGLEVSGRPDEERLRRHIADALRLDSVQ
jgi:hypothetical protein